MKGVLIVVGTDEYDGLYESSVSDLLGAILPHQSKVVLVADFYTVESALTSLGEGNEVRQAEGGHTRVVPITFIISDPSEVDEEIMQGMNWKPWSSDAVLSELSDHQWQVVVVGQPIYRILESTMKAPGGHDVIRIARHANDTEGDSGSILELASWRGVARFIGDQPDEEPHAEEDELTADARREVLKASHVGVATSRAIQELSAYLGREGVSRPRNS